MLMARLHKTFLCKFTNLQYCAKVMQTIIDEYRDIIASYGRYLNDILLETIYRAIYREAIVLTVAIYH